MLFLLNFESCSVHNTRVSFYTPHSVVLLASLMPLQVDLTPCSLSKHIASSTAHWSSSSEQGKPGCWCLPGRMEGRRSSDSVEADRNSCPILRQCFGRGGPVGEFLQGTLSLNSLVPVFSNSSVIPTRVFVPNLGFYISVLWCCNKITKAHVFKSFQVSPICFPSPAEDEAFWAGILLKYLFLNVHAF